jgi:hypothetical protein
MGGMKIDYSKTKLTKLPAILAKLNSSNLFVSVDLSSPEYGGVPQRIEFKEEFKFDTEEELTNTMDQIAKRTIAQICRSGCTKKNIFTNSDNVQMFEISGKSSDMFLKKNNIWEKYKVSLMMYADGFRRSRIAMLFQLTSGWTAAMRGNSPPPRAVQRCL